MVENLRQGGAEQRRPSPSFSADAESERFAIKLLIIHNNTLFRAKQHNEPS